MTALDPAARRALTSLLAFWAEAGVDATYAAAPVDRLAPAPPRPPPTAAVPPNAPAGAPARRPPARPPPPAAAPDATAAVQAARAAAAGAATLPALAAAAAAAAGDRSPDLVLLAAPDPLVAWIVEAPDGEDTAAGRLLAGARGRLLERMLDAAGLGGRALVLAAAPRPGPAGAGPNVADAAARLPFVERALQLAAPRAAVAAGEAALRLATGAQEPILKAHGRWRDWAGAHFDLALPLMATFSLETILAQPPAKARAWRDILTLAVRVDSPVSAP